MLFPDTIFAPASVPKMTLPLLETLALPAPYPRKVLSDPNVFEVPVPAPINTFLLP